jgi:hypothetical protein
VESSSTESSSSCPSPSSSSCGSNPNDSDKSWDLSLPLPLRLPLPLPLRLEVLLALLPRRSSRGLIFATLAGVLPIPLPAAFVYEVLCNLPVDELEAENLDSDDLADATRADEGVVSNVSEAPTILNSHTIISTVHKKCNGINSTYFPSCISLCIN